MCEQFVARAAEPFRLEALWDLTARLERYGIAGFGWGAAWLDASGGIACHRDVRAFRDDPARDHLGTITTAAALVHLRRPSRLSTIGRPDTQPFPDPAGRFAVSHNGDFARYRPARSRFRTAGRIEGRADSEVGARWLEDAWAATRPPGGLLRELHTVLGGQANLALLGADGSVHHYAGNTENPVFAFRLGSVAVVATGLYSLDRSLFRFAAPEATDRRLVPPGTVVSVDAAGRVVPD